MLLNLVIFIALPFAALWAGESLSACKYPGGNAIPSGAGMVGAIATFLLGCTWQELSFQSSTLAAVVRMVLCYALVFVPVYWFVQSTNPLAGAVCAAPVYYLVGVCALNVSKPSLPRIKNTGEVIRGPGEAPPPNQEGRKKPKSSKSDPSPSASLGEMTYEEIKMEAKRLAERDER